MSALPLAIRGTGIGLGPPADATTRAADGTASNLAALACAGLPSPHSRRAYTRAIRDFLLSGRTLTREGVQGHLVSMRDAGAGTVSRNLALSAIRLLAREANARSELPDAALMAIERVRSLPVRGKRLGNWLDIEGVRAILRAARARPQGIRDAALLACLLGCGLRRAEVCSLDWEQWQQREGRWCFVDLAGKGDKRRTVPAPDWVAEYVNEWRERKA